MNNALVVNLLEQCVQGSHLLYNSTPGAFEFQQFVFGRVMGRTKETNPRTIVYVGMGPHIPVMAKITGSYTDPYSIYGGTYTGRIVEGIPLGSTFLPNLGYNSGLPSQDNCFITNYWEQLYTPSEASGGARLLVTNTFVLGVLWGYHGSSSGNDIWYDVQTFTPPQSIALTHPVQSIVTTQTAGSSYAINEQTMMNNLKTDVTNLQLALNDWYTKMKTAGYTL